jgi:cellulose synthase/poly-beta-1,6-N-acetylglucosamine synthase-like glycosyltransferase
LTASATPAAKGRPRVHGRSICVDGRKLHVKGVTYGTFRERDGEPFPDPERVREDFEAMAAAGVNAVRTYVPPPLWLLDLAHQQELYVMPGLAWEQHVAFLDDPELTGRIVARAAHQVAECAGHPSILCYAIGNEIPAGIVRWHGKERTERFLERLFWAAKTQDPEGLFTYVNFPSTEYLELPFLDLAAWNVFLEQETTFEAYLARLQNLCGDRPLLVAEAGLDSRSNGREAQAAALEWQIEHAYGTGAAGLFVFSWTDEWHRGGHEVRDWDFGLVDRERRPKPALATVESAYTQVPFGGLEDRPRASVVVCTHNGAATLEECLEGVARLTYPDFETIVVCDGCTDDSAAIARRHGATVLETAHRGLSAARNAGALCAEGEIVAYLDDDAYPDPDWLHYVAAGLCDPRHGGVGGPNIPPEDRRTAECVAAAPGGPIHVLVSDREAEHVPGCNMAFRKRALEGIGGFDERFHVAGDDVDLCWRLQEAGWKLGFSAGAVVMHRRRDSVRRYLRQQYGYGKAEALLEEKWPQRYNRAGSSHWAGRIYDAPAAGSPRRRAMVRYGTWGSGLFQSIYEPAPSRIDGVLLAPEFLLVLLGLLDVAVLGALWAPLLLALVPLVGGIGALLWRAAASGVTAVPARPDRSRLETWRRRALVGSLFLLQPAARLCGRLRNGLSPWRRRLSPGAAWPRPRTVELWSEAWRSPQVYLQALQDALAARGGYVRSGGPFDRWDLDLRAGALGGVKIRTVVEDHGSGNQLLRVRIWPRASAKGAGAVLLLVALVGWALASGEVEAGIACAAALIVVVGFGIEGCATAMSLALSELGPEAEMLRTAEDAPAPEPEAVEPPRTLASRPAVVLEEAGR